MTTRIKFRRDTAANWTAENPVLALGEPGFEQDTNKLKIGDGETAWSGLDYASGGSDSLTSDHNIAITVGNTEYFAIVNRTNPDGDNGVDASAVAYDSEGNLITLHVSETYNTVTDDNIDQLIISKFSSTGATLWQKEIDQDIDPDTVHDVAIDADDNIIVAASVDNGEDSDSIVLIKMNSSGTVLWQKNYQGGADTFLEVGAIAINGDHVFVSGYYNDDTIAGDDSGYLMKVLVSNGSMIWAKSFDTGASFTKMFGMDVGADGHPVMVGTGGTVGPNGAAVIKLSGTNGDVLWGATLFDSENLDIEYNGGDVVVDSQNNVYVSVNTYQDIVHDDGNNTGVTIAYVSKINSSGTRQWTRRIGPGPCASVATGIDCDDSGNVYLSALTVAQKNPNREANNYYDTAINVLAMAKYSTAGAVLWQRYIECDGYWFDASSDETGAPPGFYNNGLNRGRNLSLGPNGKLAVQVSVRKKDADDNVWDSNYNESVTFQIDQDGREMTVGSGSEKFAVKASRIPGKFIAPDYTLADLEANPLPISSVTNDITVTTSAVTFSDGILAQQVAKSAPYEYVFGNDGTLTIPNDGDLKLVQTQLGWISIFGPIKNNDDNIDIRASVVDPADGSVYAVGESDDYSTGFLTRYNSAGQLLWSIRFSDNTDGYNNRANAVRIHPVSGNVMVLLEYYGSYDYTLIVEVDPDTAKVVNSFGIRDLGDSGDALAYDFAFTSSANVAIVGRKWDEWRQQSVTPLVSSTTDFLVFNASDIQGDAITNSFYVSGTGIEGRYNVAQVNRHEGLTGNTSGSGSSFVFGIYKNSSDSTNYNQSSYFITTAGNNYQINDTITVLGTELYGNTPANDLTVTVTNVDGSGGVTAIDLAGTQQNSTINVWTNGLGVNFGGVGSWTIDNNLSGEAYVLSANTAANATVSWSKLLSAGSNNDTERYFSVVVGADNSIYAAGEMISRHDAAGGDLNSYWCAVISKFDSAGNHQWTKALNDNLNDCYAKCVSIQGNVLAVSHHNSGNGVTVISKLDTSGNVKWQRRTYSIDDSSVVVDTNGDIYAVVEANFENKFNDVAKVIRFNSVGEVIWRKFIGHLSYEYGAASLRFKNGRNLTLDADHLYISGYTYAQADNYRNGVVIKIPKSGDFDGYYGNWALQQENYDVDRVYSTEATTFTPVIGTGNFENWSPDFETQWWDPSNDDYYHTLWEIADRDGGAIEFADGTRQTRSAQMIPQKRIDNGLDHRLTLEDMGGHIYFTNVSGSVVHVPYNNDNPLPIGFTVVIVNNSGGTVNIDADGGGIDIIVPGQSTAQYWDLENYGMATLLKVANDIWFLTGNVTED